MSGLIWPLNFEGGDDSSPFGDQLNGPSGKAAEIESPTSILTTRYEIRALS